MRDNRQTGNTQIVVPVMRHERDVVQQRCRRDPGVSALDPVAPGLRTRHHFRPREAKCSVIRHDHERLQVQFQTIPSLFAPRLPELPNGPTPRAS